MTEKQYESVPSPSRNEQRWAVVAFFAWLAITAFWWALAFAPLPISEAATAALRSACFGTLPNGLPDAHGWGRLTVAPLGILGVLLAVWHRPLRLGMRRMATNGSGLVFLALVGAAVIAGVSEVGGRVLLAQQNAERFDVTTKSDVSLPETYPRTDRAAPAFTLIDQHGDLISESDFANGPTLLTFAYAHCQTVCPMIVHTARNAATALETDVKVMVVTLDPWRDTPSRLPAMVEGWKLDQLRQLHLLSGAVTAVTDTLTAYEVPTQRDERTGEIAHPALIYVVDKQGRLAYTFNNPSVEWLVEAVQRLQKPPQS